MRLLLVEDDLDLSRALDQALTRHGYTTDTVGTGEAALYLLSQREFDVVVLDLGLPDMDGLQVLQALRTQPSAPPALILTARDELEQRLAGLDGGADDYVTKPFEVPELLARLRVITRRGSGRQETQLTVGDVVLEPASCRVTLSGDATEFSGKEYALLLVLMENAGRLLSREQLEQHLYPWGDQVASNAIEVHVHNIRKKLGKTFIKTVRGIGYGVGFS